MEQTVVLDSCVVIDILEKPGVSEKLRAGFRGKSIRIVLCDVVLREVMRVRGFSAKHVVGRIERLLRRPVEVACLTEEQDAAARQVTEQYQICHNGDNQILSICKANDYVLVTFDRMLLKASEWIGIAVFHPSRMGGI